MQAYAQKLPLAAVLVLACQFAWAGKARIYTNEVYAKNPHCQGMYAMEDAADQSEAIGILKRGAADLGKLTVREHRLLIQHYEDFRKLWTECENAAEKSRPYKGVEIVPRSSQLRTDYERAFLEELAKKHPSVFEDLLFIRATFSGRYERRAKAIGTTAAVYLAMLDPGTPGNNPPAPTSLLPAPSASLTDQQLSKKIQDFEALIQAEASKRAAKIGVSVVTYMKHSTEFVQKLYEKEKRDGAQFPAELNNTVAAIKKLEAGQKFKLGPVI